jgi:hypothetical protein
MNCEHARLLLGAAPRSASAELTEHLASCAGCASWRDEMLAFETRIEQALQQPPDLVPAPRAAPQWRQWAMAATVLLATCAVLGAWLLRPSDTLAHDVVAHVEHEPESWLAAQQLDANSIGGALHDSGVALDLTSDKVTYAQSCFFHGHYVPHLVLQTAQGPATVLILRHERVDGARTFHEGGMNGVIVPAAQGSIAVLARGGDVALLAHEMQRDLTWLPEPN